MAHQIHIFAIIWLFTEINSIRNEYIRYDLGKYIMTIYLNYFLYGYSTSEISLSILKA